MVAAAAAKMAEMASIALAVAINLTAKGQSGRRESGLICWKTCDWQEVSDFLSLELCDSSLTPCFAPAEIGQALVKRHDDAVAQSTKAAADYVSQRDSLMNRLTSSIKESQSLQRQLLQSNLNLEAADSSNRTLIGELEDTRSSLAKLRKEHVKCALVSSRAERLGKELEDVRQESIAMRKREEGSASLAKRVGRRNEELVEQLKRKVEELELFSRRQRDASEMGNDVLDQARERLRIGAEAIARSSQPDASEARIQAEAYQEMLQKCIQDSEALKEENRYLKDMLEAKTEEASVLKQAQLPRSFPPNHQRSLSLAASADIPSPTTPSQAVADTLQHEEQREQEHGNLSLGDEMSAAEPPAKALDRVEKRGSPSLLISPPTRTLELPNKSPQLAQVSPVTSAAPASSASDHSSIKEKEGGDDFHPPQAAHATQDSRDESSSRPGSRLQRQPSLVPKERDTRTTQLSNLMDSVQRLFTRLESADIDTLTRRLQRQHLTGDVGHLARTTINSIIRDVDGLREHFRRLVEQEARSAARDEASSNASSKVDTAAESLLARRDFFTLIKSFKELFLEIAKLRGCINEIHLQPSQSARLLQEHLGLMPVGEKGLLAGAAWISKMWSGAAAPITAATATAVGSVTGSSSKASEPSSNTASTVGGGNPSAAQTGLRAAAARRVAPRAEPSIVSTSATAVAASSTSPDPSKHSQAKAQIPSIAGPPTTSALRPNPNLGRRSLSRVQSRNLSGLFAGAADLPSGSWDVVDRKEAAQDGLQAAQARLRAGLIPNRGPAQRPLSRIVDDDEVSIRHGRTGEDSDFRAALERTMRPRGLSDSSIHSTFLAHEDAGPSLASVNRPSPVSRLITASTLALQVAASGAHATARAVRPEDAGMDSPAMSEDSMSTTGLSNSGKDGAVSPNPSSAASRMTSFFPSLSALRPAASPSIGVASRESGRTASLNSLGTGSTSLSSSPSTPAAQALLSSSPHSPLPKATAAPISANKTRHARKASLSRDEHESLGQSFAYNRLQRNHF